MIYFAIARVCKLKDGLFLGMVFKRPPDEETISDPEQIRAISSPVRHAIHQVVLSQGQASISEIANQLGKPAASLYRHIDKLVEVGLLVEDGTKSTARRDAKVYSSTLEFFRYADRDIDMVDAISGFARASLKETGKQLTRTFERGDAVLPVPGRDTFIGSPSGWLDPDEIGELNEHIDAIIALMANKPRREGTKRITISMGMYPSAPDAG